MVTRFLTKAVLLGVRWGIARYVARHVHGTLWMTEQRLRIYRDIQILRLRRKQDAKKERRQRRWTSILPAWKNKQKP